ncbi:MAG TPA: hypothetical protein VGI70_01155, partial [Polyangiales bacterium]
MTAADSGSDAGEAEKPAAADGGGSDRDAGATQPLTACGGKMCKSPATCSDDNSHCVCPTGYDDAHGDGSQCDDHDE